MHDDIFEEDMFEEESARVPSEEVDEETQHVLELMKKGLRLAEEVTECFDKIIEINELFEETITGVPTNALRQMRAVYSNMLPDLIVGEKEQLVAVASQSELNLYRIIFVTKQSMMKIIFLRQKIIRFLLKFLICSRTALANMEIKTMVTIQIKIKLEVLFYIKNIVFNIIRVCILAPISEEIVLRGVVYNNIKK